MRSLRIKSFKVYRRSGVTFTAFIGLDTLGLLEELWLGKNKITTIQGLESLSKLKRLSLQSNRIVKLGIGLKPLVSLEELYLSHQGIAEVEGLEGLTKLNTLDLSSNRITSLKGIPVHDLPELVRYLLHVTCHEH